MGVTIPLLGPNVKINFKTLFFFVKTRTFFLIFNENHNRSLSDDPQKISHNCGALIETSSVPRGLTLRVNAEGDEPQKWIRRQRRVA